MFLLDINVLLARVDQTHLFHERAKVWFQENLHHGWATCPLTENGFLRIAGTPSYPGIQGSPTDLRLILDKMCSWSGHAFWPDTLTLRDPVMFPTLTTPKALTDLYLLGLAVDRGGKFATFDARIDASLIPGGEEAYYLIP